MKLVTRCLFIVVALSTLLFCTSAYAQDWDDVIKWLKSTGYLEYDYSQYDETQPVPTKWQKMTGPIKNYSGVADGIAGNLPNTPGDRQNSYAWSMECLDGYLYVGTSRNVLAPMLVALGVPPAQWPPEFYPPTDMRGRIFRMKLTTGQWSLCYVCDPVVVPNQPLMGKDLGYRMMKTFTATGADPVLYVGGTGLNACRMLAVEKTGKVTPVFSTSAGGTGQKLSSVRAITEYNSQLCWASEDTNGVAFWCASNPLKQYKANPNVKFERIGIPNNWFPEGAEIWDMISFNGFLYVFLVSHDIDGSGFWCVKFWKNRSTWTWKVIVGDAGGLSYAPGMGRKGNGAGVPFLFKDKVYVGTMDATAIRMTGMMSGGGPPPNMDVFSQPNGQQIFRFDKYDKWERVMPTDYVKNPEISDLLSGFVNPMNVYIWRFGACNGKLYAGTFDARTMLESIGPFVGIPEMTLINPRGFDLYSTTDGIHWTPESLNGFKDEWNYGARSFATDPKTGDMYLGTANPFYGCQVWKKPAK